ncbi:MAG: DUF3106 domain-containing protein [Piscinibacter sp.]|nr:DUF3106 domain-containing protein [Piscinibacter sp.]
MKLHLAATLLVLACGPLAAAPASAPTDAQREAVRERWKQMTPEEQAAAKAKAKAKWDSMTPEEQAAAKKRFAEKHPRAGERGQSRHAPAAAASGPQPPASAPAK